MLGYYIKEILKMGCACLFCGLLGMPPVPAQSSLSPLQELDTLIHHFQFAGPDGLWPIQEKANGLAEARRFAPYGDVLRQYLLAEYSASTHIRMDKARSPKDMYKENILLLEKGDLTDVGQALLALNLHSWGMSQYRDGDISGKEALPLLLRAHQVCKNLGYGRCPQTARMLSGLGEFYHLSKEYHSAIQYLELARPYVREVPQAWPRINHANTLGLAYLATRQYEAALACYADVMDFVESPADSIWIGIANGNMAEIHYRMGNAAKALNALEVDIAYSKQYQDTCSVAEAYILQLKGLLLQDAPQQAAASLDSMQAWTGYCDSPTTLKNSLLAESMYQEWKGDYALAYQKYKQSRSMRDSLLAQRLEQKIQANTIRFEAERYQLELEAEQQQRAYLQLQRNVALAFILGLLLFAFIFYKYRRAQAERQGMAAELEKQRLEQSLRDARMELRGFSDSLREKNQIIAEISRELEETQGSVDKDAIIAQLCQSTILTTEDWLRFSHLFEQVYPDFIPSVKEKYPGLTQNDIRILVLSQLEFSARDMASTLGVSMDAIHKAKYRLRKKLALPQGMDFTDIVQSMP